MVIYVKTKGKERKKNIRDAHTHTHTHRGNTLERCSYRIVLYSGRLDGLESPTQRCSANDGFDIEEAAYSQDSDRICAADF